MKIGVACTTYNRPDHHRLWMKQVETFKEHNVIYIAVDGRDKERRGIAYRKNECLRQLKDCDYIFLFDDDCFPIKEGWTDFFINASRDSGQQHFMYLRETPTIKKTGVQTNDKFETSIGIYDNCSGCMLFLTKDCLNIVGAMNPKYGLYGYEHAGYSNRIHKAGMTPLGAYTCPEGAEEYIYSMDLDFHRKNEFQKVVKHRPSMGDEVKNIPKYITQNGIIYMEDTDIYHPL